MTSSDVYAMAMSKQLEQAEYHRIQRHAHGHNPLGAIHHDLENFHNTNADHLRMRFLSAHKAECEIQKV